MNPGNAISASPAALAGESVQEPGQPLRVASSELEWGLHHWASSVIRTGDEVADRAAASALAENNATRIAALCRALDHGTADRAVVDDLLSEVIALGLEVRMDLHLLDEELDLFRALMKTRSNPHAPPPAGVAVCERCDRVFRPKQESHAATCGYCRDRPNSETRWGSQVGEDGTVTFNSPIEAVSYSKTCKKCLRPFLTRRKDQDFCNISPATGRPGSDACRKAYKRNGGVADPVPCYEDFCEWESPEQRAEVEAAMAEINAQFSRAYAQQLCAGIREFVATRSGPRITWDDLEAERRGRKGQSV